MVFIIMAKIHLLSLHEAQKIAAGEVVERPASVVKELLENALDAGATSITLYIKDGGKSLIRVVDNGCGMSIEDARASILKHATSKITCIDDLNTIATFGFRGEALAALASVSRVTIITKETSTHEGIKLTVENGIILKEETVAAQTGTTVEILDLFYNVPARQKFLKKRETEFRQIQHLFNAISLVHPYICTQFYSEDVLIAQYTPTQESIERCKQVMHVARHQTLLPMSATEHGIEISGVISDHQWFKYDRSHIFLFVNKRWVKNQALTRAVMRGYSNVLPTDRFPVAHLMLTVPAYEVDVNVHPRKEEVLFAHPHRVETLIATTIKQTLSHALPTPLAAQKNNFATVSPMQSSLHNTSFNLTPSVVPPYAFKTDFPLTTTHVSVTPDITFMDNTDKQEAQQSITKQPAQSLEPVYIQEKVVEKLPYTIIGQLHNTYILIEHANGLMMIDQHAAHEAILYERFMMRADDQITVQLLFPELVTISQADWHVLFPFMSLLQEKGIIIEQFGETHVRVLATPVHLKHTNLEELIRYMISIINEYNNLDKDECARIIHKKLCAQMACKAAVKASDILDEHQMKTLLKDLDFTENRLTCPHGRPTHWLISTYEIEKKFKRIV